MIYLTGDTHGSLNINRLICGNKNVLDTHIPISSLTEDDYLIICGDFGLIFYDPAHINWVKENNAMKSLCKQKFTTLFVDGNHENFNLLNSYPVLEMFDGNVHKINDKVFHLCRGEVYNIQGYRLFTMGGGSSIDKNLRTLNFDYWQEELPSYAEYEHALTNLDNVNWKVDYVITHCASTSVVKQLVSNLYMDNEMEFFESISKKLTYKHWYCGHYHKDIDVGGTTCLYNQIIPLGATLNDF